MRRVAFSLATVGIIGNLAYGFSSSSPSSLTSATHSLHTSPISAMKRQARPFGVNPFDDRSHPAGKAAASVVRGGETESTDGGVNAVTNFGNAVASFWAAGGVAMILLNSIRRIVPIAMEPFQAAGKAAVDGAASSVQPLTQFQLAAYVLTCIWFAYVEGYKGFQRKFSPMVVNRSFTLKFGESPFHHFLFGPFYAMGLFHATKKRMIVSWSVSFGVAAIVVAVKKLPYPWRNVVDAGVVVGLSWGTLSILLSYIKSLTTGEMPEGSDPALPEKK